MRSRSVLTFLFACLACTFAVALSPVNPGDLNADNVVSVADVFVVSGCLGQNAVSCQSGRADPNNDATVNIFDFIHVSSNWGRTYGVLDTTPPDPTITSPTMNQVIPGGTSQWTLTVATNEQATCKHHGSDTTYAAMSNTFSGTGTTTHTSTLTLQDGQTRTRYVRCLDLLNNTMQSSEFVTYSVGTGSGQTCGNGVREGTESCDLGAGNGACPSTCSASCTTNTCTNNCGNGAIDSGEQCDGTNLGGATCASRGFTGGTLTCHTTTCQYVTTACTNPSGGTHPHEPAGFSQKWENDFSTSFPSSQFTYTGQAGCWYTNGGTGSFQNGYWVVNYPVGWADARTPATMHGEEVCPPHNANPAPEYAQMYFHLTGYTPGYGTQFWQNGNGYKLMFMKIGGGSLILKCDNTPSVPSGLADFCWFNINWESAGNPPNFHKTSGIKLLVGQPNDIECVLTSNTVDVADGRLECWVNGQTVVWNNLLMRVNGETANIYGTWLDWTYGGGGGGIGVGVQTKIAIDGEYASAP